MRAKTLLFLALFFAICALPLAERWLHLGPALALTGAVEAPLAVPLSVSTYRSGEFQQAFEQAFNAELGFRAALVRADNELNLRAFKEFAPGSHTPLLLGKRGFIYEREYVDDLNRRDLVEPALLESKVLRLKLLKDYLDARHIALLVLVSPSKALVYPEYVPDRFLARERLELGSNYQVFVALLRQYGLDFVDAQELASEWKTSLPAGVFANTGAHWNDPAACNVTARVLDSLKKRLAKPLLQLKCEPYTMSDVPLGLDRDLLDVANLWSESALYRQTPYTQASVVAEGAPERPSVLFVGSSFVWAILDYVNKYHTDLRDTFLYYYKVRFTYPGRRRSELSQKRFDFQREILDKNAVVIEINASAVQSVGWGFLEDAERVLKRRH